jgi:hypothetical protein
MTNAITIHDTNDKNTYRSADLNASVVTFFKFSGNSKFLPYAPSSLPYPAPLWVLLPTELSEEAMFGAPQGVM